MAGLVLCGGASTRMGTDKALLEVDGVPLVLRVAARLEEVAEPVILAPGRVGRLGFDPGYPEVADALPGGGPLAGLVAGLEASPHPWTAVAAVDMPFADPAVFALLVSKIRNGEAVDAMVPVTAHGSQPLHAVYGRTALPSLRASLTEGRLALRAALDGLAARLVAPESWAQADPSGRFALNLNRLEDLGLLP